MLQREIEEIKGLQNLRKSFIHLAITIIVVVPCEKMIRWFIHHTNENTKKFCNAQGKIMASFLPVNVEYYYKFPRTYVYLVDD